MAAFFFFNDTATTEIYTLSLHDALPIYPGGDAEQHRERHDAPERERGQERRVAEVLADDVLHRELEPRRITEVARRRLAQIFRVADRQRPVQAHLAQIGRAHV